MTSELTFKVTQEQKETIDFRVRENGFENLSSYLKIAALKTQSFTLTFAGVAKVKPTIELSFLVTEQERELILEKMKENQCEELDTYLAYVAQHTVISGVIEVRSTGTLDAMLARIAKSRK
jgi:hypothetical protein